MIIRASYFLLSLLVVACNTQPDLEPIFIDCAQWSNWESQDGLKCGFIYVPEDHDQPSGKKIELAFAMMDGNNEGENIPTIYLTGGPGGDAMGDMRRFQRDSLLQIGSVILVDQRGVGKSSSLPDMGDAVLDVMARDLNLREEQEQLMLLHDEIKGKIEAGSVSLANYNTTQNARDIGLLMETLGYSRYNLWGGSYGTKLAVYVMKYFPEKINAAALSSPAVLNGKGLENRFPDFIGALDKLIDKCKSDEQCNESNPNLKENILDVLKKLDEDPVTLDLAGREFVMNPQDAVFLIRYMLYRSNAVDLLTGFLKAAENNDLEEISRTCADGLGVFNGVNITAFYSYNAYEEFSPETVSNIEGHVASSEILSQAGLGWFQTFIPLLTNWHSRRVSQEEMELKEIGVPTLVVTNTFDPVTPPENSRMFQEAITSCQVINLAEFGHGGFTPCMGKIRREFLADPKRKIDKSCLE